MFTHALTVCTQGMILSDWTTLLDLCVSSTAHILSQVLPARAPDDASHASNVASPASVSLQFFLALLLAGALTVSHTRHDVASPASVSVHSIASIVEPGLGGGPTLALLRTLSQTDFTSPSPSRRLMED